MKTAACWLGNTWTVRTKKLGDAHEHTVSIDVDRVASGDTALPYRISGNLDPSDHYTVIEITDLNKTFQGRTLGKIRDFLRYMYRQDLRAGSVNIEWQGNALAWSDAEYQFLEAPDGTPYRSDFNFEVSDKQVVGWVGILARGSRARAGFSILLADRVIRGWPDSWRPESIYGQILGSNDLVNQRIIGEIHLDGYEVSHTKDDVLWFGDEEDQVQDQLRKVCTEYIAVARTARGGTTDGRGPTDAETSTAIDELERELSSSEITDRVNLDPVLSPEVAQKSMAPIIRAVAGREPDFATNIGSLEVFIYLMGDGSPNDPYVAVDSTHPSTVMVSVNKLHPHWGQLKGSEGVLNYLRHCVYDAIAEWKARSQLAPLDPATIKMSKDGMLRNPIDLNTTYNRPQMKFQIPVAE